MKSNAIIRIVLFSLAILILLGIFVSAMLVRSFMIDLNTSGVVDTVQSIFDHDREIPMEQIYVDSVTADIRNLEIEWVAGSITFQKDPNVTDISIHEFSPTDSKYQMVCKQSGQTLKIQFCEEDLGPLSLGINVDVSKDLVITIPADWACHSLEIDTAAAEVIMNDLTIQEFDFDGASGECRMTNCDIGELDIDTASGNVHFSGTLETLDCDAASADCTIEVINIPRSIKMDGLSGDLELVLPPNAGFTCNLDAMSSSFDTDFEFKMQNDQYVCGDGSCRIMVSALSGDVSILKGIA